MFDMILQHVKSLSVTTFGRKDFLHDSVNFSEDVKRFRKILFEQKGCLLRKVECKKIGTRKNTIVLLNL